MLKRQLKGNKNLLMQLEKMIRSLLVLTLTAASFFASAQEDMCSVKFAESSDTLNVYDVLISDNTSDCDTIRVVVAYLSNHFNFE